MPLSDPGEWVSITPFRAIQVTDAGPAVVVVKAGLVQRPGGDGLRLALQVEDDPIVIISPAATVQLIAALRRGLVELAARDWTC